MLAAQIVAPRTVEIVETPIRPAEEGEVVVKLETACLCGSDSPFFDYDFEEIRKSGRLLCSARVNYSAVRLYPLPIGLSLHECAGTVVESRSRRFQIGDFVLAFPVDLRGFCEYVTLTDRRIYTLPTEGASREDILMAQPLGTVLFALRKLPMPLPETVVVVGQGPIGLLVNAALAHRGVKRIVGIDKIATRLSAAKLMGATDVLDASQLDLSTTLRELNEGELAPLVVEAVGHGDLAVRLCLELVQQDGQILVLGSHDSLEIDGYPAGLAMRKNVSLHHSIGASEAKYFQAAADLIATGTLDVSPLLTHRFPFRQAQDAFEHFVDRKDGALKVLIEFEEKNQT